jgi:colicin import membrane protein
MSNKVKFISRRRKAELLNKLSQAEEGSEEAKQLRKQLGAHAPVDPAEERVKAEAARLAAEKAVKEAEEHRLAKEVAKKKAEAEAKAKKAAAEAKKKADAEAKAQAKKKKASSKKESKSSK